MLIDWFTVFAQVLNFLVLVWLMKRYLYKPILNAIDAREKRIDGELSAAKQSQDEAQKDKETYQQRLLELNTQKGALLAKATEDAEGERKRLLEEARQTADAAAQKSRDELATEYSRLSTEITRRTQQEVFDIARKVLGELADESLESKVVEVFLRRMRALGDSEKADMKSAFAGSSNSGVVRSTYDLTTVQRSAIETEVKAVVGSSITLSFETAPETMGGIEFSTKGWRVGWNIAESVSSLDRSVGELLSPNPAKSAPKLSAQPTAKVSELPKSP